MTSELKPIDERVPDFFHSGSLKLLGNSPLKATQLESEATDTGSDEILEIHDEDLQVIA